MKIFKTTNDYVSTKYNDSHPIAGLNGINYQSGSSHILDTVSKHRKSHSYRNKSNLISKYQKLNIQESRIKNIKMPSEVSFKQPGTATKKKKLDTENSYSKHTPNKENLARNFLGNPTLTGNYLGDSSKKTEPVGLVGDKSKNNLKYRPATGVNDPNLNTKSKSRIYKSPGTLKDRISKVFQLVKRINNIKTVKTKSFYGPT